MTLFDVLFVVGLAVGGVVVTATNHLFHGDADKTRPSLEQLAKEKENAQPTKSVESGEFAGIS